MIEKTFSLLYYLKPSKNDRNGLKSIYMRITVDSQRFEMSTKYKCHPDKWLTAANRVKGKTEEARMINSYLDTLQLKVHQVRKYLLDNDKEISLKNIKNVLQGKSEQNRMILEIFSEHNEKMEALVGQEFAEGTLERYKTSFEHTKAFIQWKYKKDDLEIKKLDYDFISDYSFWLKSVRGCAHNTTVKYLGNFKKIVLSCIKKGWLIRDPFVGFKLAKKEVPRHYLTFEELEALEAKYFEIERLNQVRDIFLFSCYTGLAYIDVKKLRRDQIIIGLDKEKWIITSRQKTESSVRIPLLPKAQKLMDKYYNHPKCEAEGLVLPVLSNQKMNAYLKEIADLCGIKKELTFHIARHTFATTVTLSNGVPIETVSKMLGHKSLKQTQHYAKIVDLKVSEDMKLLKSKLGQ
ncbi:site-specific integrase [Mongoliitalea daihaiensis]|uniref:site-specific integrase n=1 Tax=Mongoliitalea daihaiensis TaxID=2782006 RepID=UPI001F379471|nr:site-specific integrase [Mongoliitalea daihaiensis]UJP63955.1 site-specific integrase [Mongoliitalea daihaiensis]